MSGRQPGQYVPGDSLIHRLDPGVKIVCLFLFSAAIIAASTGPGYAAAIVALAVIVRLSGLAPGAGLASLYRLRIFFIVIFLMNALFYSTDQPLWSWGVINLTSAGIRQGAKVVFNVLFIMTLANVLTSATAPLDLTAGLAGLLKPLRPLRLPVEDVAMILGIALRFVPTLLEEADMIKKAQTARGARFESKKLRERAASFLPLFIPVFLAAFRRADDLSLAMEARGYRNAKNRTRKAGAPLKKRDYAALGAGFVIFFVQIYFLGND